MNSPYSFASPMMLMVIESKVFFNKAAHHILLLSEKRDVGWQEILIRLKLNRHVRKGKKFMSHAFSDICKDSTDDLL